METTNHLPIEPSGEGEVISRILAAIVKGMEAFVEAGQMLVAYLKVEPDAYAKIVAAEPRISVGLLEQLEAVGRGAMHPDLLVAEGPGIERAKRLPYSEQVKVLTEPVEVLIEKPDGSTDVLLVDVRHMSDLQARQTMGRGHLHSHGEQRAFLADLKMKAQAKRQPVMEQPWKIEGREVVFKAGTRMSAKDLTLLAAQLQR